MMHWFKRIFVFIFSLLLLWCLWNHKLVLYGYQQLKGQLQIILNAKPVEVFLNDPEIKDSLKLKLKLIEEIKAFAQVNLGLKNSNNYSTFYDQKGKPVLWVLTACPPFEMKPYEWNFPFLGKVTYKGFFEKEIGEREQQLLKRQLYDTDLSPTGGWSTLGWFKDPILSNMLKKGEGRLAELIIHELTHLTVYLKVSVEYNENLATFIGEEGAIKFLTFKYGKESSQLQEYIAYKQDEEIYGNYMIKSSARLDSLYKTMEEEDFRKKLQLKYKLIAEIILGINHLPLNHSTRYVFKFPVAKLPDNTWFMSFKRYRSKQTEFANNLKKKYDGDLKNYIESLKD